MARRAAPNTTAASTAAGAARPHTSRAAVRRDCARCGAPVLHQTAGLPVTVTADTEHHTPAQAADMTGPNRLQWCLRESRWSGDRLTEVMPSVHPADCPRPHVIDHQCPPGTPPGRRPEGALW